MNVKEIRAMNNSTLRGHITVQHNTIIMLDRHIERFTNAGATDELAVATSDRKTAAALLTKLKKCQAERSNVCLVETDGLPCGRTIWTDDSACDKHVPATVSA